MPNKEQILEREQRWRLPAGIAAVAGVALIVASFGDSAAAVRGGGGIAERLADVQGEHGKLLAAGIIQLLGWSLLAFPLGYLFKAAAARAPRMRSALIGVVLIAPVLIGLGGLLGAASVIQASDSFLDRPAAETAACVEKKVDAAGDSSTKEPEPGQSGSTGEGGPAPDSGSDGKAAGKPVSSADREQFQTECEDEAAKDARAATSIASLETGVGLAGLLGFTIAVLYTALWSMRTGLLSRFWGALGIALGAVFVFFTLFTLGWFIYLGLLLVGWVPGGRPPAWAAGEAVEPPQPKGGGGLFGPRQPRSDQTEPEGQVDKWGEPIDGTSRELEPETAPEPLELDDSGDETGTGASAPRRKRKKRNG